MAYSLELFVSVLEMNIDNRGKTPPLSPTGYPLIEVKHIQEDRLYPVFEDTKYVDQETWDTWFRAHLKPGDILFSTVGSIARSCMVPENPKFCVAQNVLGFRVNRAKADPRFLYYAINDSFFQQEVRGRTIETVQKSIKVHDLKTCRIPLPPLAEQKAIAKILGDLDDKIELNRKMNTTLEAMARALFQSWFVDFDPVRAKMDGREPVGMDAETAALWPAAFEESELGLVPKGWDVRSLAELIEVVKGRSYRSDELAESKTALVTLKSFLRGGGYRTDGLKPFTGEYKPNQRVRPGDLVVAFTDVTQAAEVIGKPALVRSDDRFEALVASLDVGIVRPKSKNVSIPFLYCLFLTSEFQAHTYSHASGTTVLHLGSTAIPSFVSVVPPVDIAIKFAERTEPIFRLIDENATRSRTLATLRDTLLPKLMSGELQTTNLEREIELVKEHTHEEYF